MISNAKRGAYFKARTKKWLIAGGWQVADLEVVRWIYRPGQSPMPVKRDQFGSDLLAMNGERIVFVQVKGGEAARGGTFPAARREFDKFTFPIFVERWVVAWAPRARQPRIVVLLEDNDGKKSMEGAAQESGQGQGLSSSDTLSQWAKRIEGTEKAALIKKLWNEGTARTDTPRS